MNLPPIQHRLEAADVPPERLADNSRLTEEQKIAEATRQFEALLLRQILANTQKPVIPSKYTDNSARAGIYRDLATYQLADSISKSGTLGLAQTLERDFTRQLRSGPSAMGHCPPETSPAASDGQDTVRSDTCSAKPDWRALTTGSSLPRAAAALANHERTSTKPH
jgi:flagellar protein FlgJ